MEGPASCVLRGQSIPLFTRGARRSSACTYRTIQQDHIRVNWSIHKLTSVADTGAASAWRWRHGMTSVRSQRIFPISQRAADAGAMSLKQRFVGESDDWRTRFASIAASLSWKCQQFAAGGSLLNSIVRVGAIDSDSLTADPVVPSTPARTRPGTPERVESMRTPVRRCGQANVNDRISFGRSISTFRDRGRGSVRPATTRRPGRITIRAAPCTDANRTGCKHALWQRPTCWRPTRGRITDERALPPMHGCPIQRRCSRSRHVRWLRWRHEPKSPPARPPIVLRESRC